ncbi:G-type lectin S-receptor-like serine/threonine-protein kinase At2g19130 [Elaeis guineensis]|uniref:G-type lectin S-receptor-like serine/threonine-protein kinase At2g19130 n=1 Tax=Elaeis guineensis var. tenera TaxID=51953 RepID=UPI003C6CFC67
MVSRGGNFELGFFTSGNPHKYYLGIWYKKVSKQTVVWVANRERPVFNTSSSELKLSKNGNLNIVMHSKNIIWSSSSMFTASNSTIAVLHDDGNLVIKDDSNSHFSWQSFDHPTNTWLPGAKLGYDRFSKENRYLTSWRNSEDPSPGLFSAEVNPNGFHHFLLISRNRQYWPSGIEDILLFSSIPALKKFYSFNYVTDGNTSYFNYFVHDSSVISNYMLDFTGQMKRRVWNNEIRDWVVHCIFPSDPCDVNTLCGPFSSCRNYSSPSCECLRGFEPLSMEDWNLGDHTGGCVRKAPLQCGEIDGFMKLSNVQLPVSPEPLALGSAKKCEVACFNKCSCVAYSYDKGCLIWNGEILNLKTLSDSAISEGGSGVLYLRLASSELMRPNNEKSWEYAVVIFSSVAGFALITGIVLVLIWRFWKTPEVASSETVQGFLVMFDYKVIRRATKDFSEKLGQGSFGTVFKGILSDSTVIAVKKLEGLCQGEKQFRTEVSTIGMIHHVNLVHLRGFCSVGDVRLLVYDYVPRGSLDSYLFSNDFETLNWDQRFQIALGVARGLTYLHEKCRECIVHCDIKPENVLLDVGMCAKISDFGMAKLIGHEFSQVLTTMRGTIGYLAPEWLCGSSVTPKADVYSYGLVLLEIISGRRNTDRLEDGKFLYFPVWAAIKLHECDILCLLDEKLEGNANVEELSRACKIACWCIQDLESNRPTMAQVVQQLEGLSNVSMPPIPRLLQKLVMDDSKGDRDAEFFSTSESSEEFSRSSKIDHSKVTM